MPRVIKLLLFFGLFIVALTGEARAASPTIDVLQAKGVINPVLAEYIERGIDHAENNNAMACIIQLDTPGGLDTSMRDIVQRIVSARVPIVVYVSPSGARAASAGVFVTMAAHVAAMAPNTNIGAAHPVALGGEGEAQMSDTMEEKVINDAAAYIRSIAQAHGRNMDWAEKAVRESVSATETEARDLNVIDLVASNLNDLVSQLNGREITMLDGKVVTLQTTGATLMHIDMTAGERILQVISDPNIAYLLLSVAGIGILVEISNPGLIFPGVIGGICGLLAFYSLGVLPVNYAGVLLVVLAFGLFIAELFTSSFGILTAGGVISLVLGSLILFKGGPLFQVSPWLIAITAIIVAAIFGFVITRVISAHRQQATTGWEDLVGKTAVVKIALNPEGTVLYRGELWRAVSDTGRVESGEEVTVNRVDGLLLHVSKK